MLKTSSLFLGLFVCAALAATHRPAVADDVAGGKLTSLMQVTSDIRYLASDELKGRQPGTPEMKLAEDYIVAAFQQAGLEPVGDDGTFLQQFDAGANRSLTTIKEGSSQLILSNGDGVTISPESGTQFSQLVHGQTIDLENTPAVFVGYGIDAGDEHNYDDYRDVDVDGKVVILIRREPQQSNEDSVFNGDEVSRYAYLQSKVRSAVAAGAAAIVMVNDRQTLINAGEDALPSPEQFGSVSMNIPFAHLKRASLNQLLATTPVRTGDGEELKTVDAIETYIDTTLDPVSQPLSGWTVTLAAEFETKKVLTSNIVGMIRGEGPLADETIVVGAHYDHLGMGSYGSRSSDAGKAIHNGADDNATGTAAVMELARRFARAEQRPKRSILFICFSAEEMGLLGAQHYVNSPLVPLENSVAMINFDMIGYLREKKLTLYGWNTAKEFEAMIEAANSQSGEPLDLDKPASGFAGSDHLPFDSKQIPNMFLHTGLTDVYHTPEDDFEAINCAGAVEVIAFSERLIREIANAESKPTYGKKRRRKPSFKLGVVAAKDADSQKMEVRSVKDDSPASRAGFEAGDLIVSIGDDSPIDSRRRLSRAIKRNVGKTITIRVIRAEEEVELEATLGE